MSGGTTRYDEIVPHDEIFRVKREWIELSGGKPMPFFARYTAWGVWGLGVVLSLVFEYALGLMNLGILSALIVLASVIFESMAVMAVFLFGVDFDKPMLAVLAQLWRGVRLRFSGLLPSHKPRPTTFVLRATARQQRPVHTPWYRRIVRRFQPPVAPTSEAEIEPSEPAVPSTPRPRRALAFVGRFFEGVGTLVVAEPRVFVAVVLGISLFVFNPWSK